MKTKFSSAFTLIEIVTAMTVILILTSMVIAIAGFVINKGNKARAQGELTMLSTALDSYKADCGRFPQDIVGDGTTEGITDKVKSKQNFIPTDRLYQDSCLFLYKELTGDRDGGSNGEPDGVKDAESQEYWKDRNISMIKADFDNNRKIIRVHYIQDPWGFSYGYSTAAMFEEQKFQKRLKDGERPDRLKGDQMPGFNPAAPDLWSTGNSKPGSEPASPAEKDKLWAKWLKNW